MMDHALRSISYIADIGDLLVIMARRRLVPPGNAAAGADGAAGNQAANGGAGGASAITSTSAIDDVQVIGTTPKMICHVFESEEVSISDL